MEINHANVQRVPAEVFVSNKDGSTRDDFSSSFSVKGESKAGVNEATSVENEYVEHIAHTVTTNGLIPLRRYLSGCVITAAKVCLFV
jgi:hypothetical protein